MHYDKFANNACSNRCFLKAHNLYSKPTYLIAGKELIRDGADIKQ